MTRTSPMKRVMMRMKPGEMQDLAHSARNPGLPLILRGPAAAAPPCATLSPVMMVVVPVLFGNCGGVGQDDGGGRGFCGPGAVCFPALDHGFGYVGKVDRDGGGEALDDDFAVDGGVHGWGDGGADGVCVGEDGGDDRDVGFVGDVG